MSLDICMITLTPPIFSSERRLSRLFVPANRFRMELCIRDSQYANREEEIRKAKGNPNKNNHSQKKNSNYGGYTGSGAGAYMAQKLVCLLYTSRCV